MRQDEADEIVRRLRELPIRAEQHVRALTGLDDGETPQPGLVVDRCGWIDAATGGMARLTDGLALPDGLARRIAARAAGVQAGLAMAFLASRVLGQYDPFGGPAQRPGRLLLVAPNVLAVQRSLDVPAEDFRMWVCLHESTHRLQFSAVPWLRDYFADQVSALVRFAEDAEGLAAMARRLPGVLRDARHDGVRDPIDLFERMQAPEQRTVLNRLIALGTLLEGHADHVMDAVGPSVVPNVALIRRRFTARRHGGGMLERVLRTLVGIDAKTRQYEQGAAFTRHVVGAAGMAGFNRVWHSPETLPTRTEITEPDVWLQRVG